MPKKYFIEIQNVDRTLMMSRDFDTAQEAKNWAEGIKFPHDAELWLMAAIGFGDAVGEEYVERLDEDYKQEINTDTYDPCENCKRQDYSTCYGCPHAAEDKYDA